MLVEQGGLGKSNSMTRLTDAIPSYDSLLWNVEEQGRHGQTPVEQNCGQSQLRICRKSHITFSHHAEAPSVGCQDRNPQDLVEMAWVFVREQLPFPGSQARHLSPLQFYRKAAAWEAKHLYRNFRTVIP